MTDGDLETLADRASRVYGEFLNRRLRGERAPISELCANHPDLAEELRALDSQQATLDGRQTTGDDRAAVALYVRYETATQGAARRYAIRSKLAQGGMGVILRVWDNNLSRELAMKLIRGQEQLGAGESVQTASPEALARFLREAEITARLDHPGVVPIHELGSDEHGRLFFTMRLIEGKSLAAVFRQLRSGHERWTRTRVLDVIVKVCETVAYAHSRNIIHRDLKPDNVMVGRFGEAYVMDWGLAKVLRDGGEPVDEADEAEPLPATSDGMPGVEPTADGETPLAMTLDGSVVGTAPYMPPEQAAGCTDLDERSDIYSVGMILYDLLAGRHPYARPGVAHTWSETIERVRAGPPEAVSQLNPRAHAELVAICEKATARNREDRYQRMQEMADDLRAYLERRVVRAYQTGAVAELKKWVARNRGVAIASVAAILASVGGLLAVVGVQSAANRSLFDANQTIRKETSLKQAALEKETKAKQSEIAARRAEETARRRAEGLFLARESADVVASNPAQALLLGLESHARQPSFEANSALLAALPNHHEERTFVGHRAGILSLALGSDGSRAVTASQDKTAIVWDLAKGEPVAWLVGHTDWVRHAKFSPDRRYVLTASSDRTAALWDATTGERLRIFSGHDGSVQRAVFSPDGTRVATASVDKTVRVWDTATGEALFVLRGHEAQVSSVAFNPQGTVLLSASDDKTARLWDASTGEPRAKLEGHLDGIRSALFSSDGHTILTTPSSRSFISKEPSGDCTARLWETQTGKFKRALEHPALPLSAAFSSRGHLIVTGAADGGVRVWDATTGDCQHDLKVSDGAVISVAFGPDDRLVAAGTQRGSVWLWDLTRPTDPIHLRGHTAEVGRVVFRSSNELVTASADGTARLWRVRAHGRVEAGASGDGIDQQHPGGMRRQATVIRDVAVSADGSRLAVSSPAARTVSLNSFPDGRQVAALEHDTGVQCIRFSPGGDLIATGEAAGIARVWSAVDGRRCASFAGTGKLGDVRFGAEDHLVVLSHRDRLVTVWNTRTGESIHRLELDGSNYFRLSPNARYLLAWSPVSSDAEIVDTETGERVTKLSPVANPPGDALSIQFSPDGRRVVTSSGRRRQAQLRDTTTGGVIAHADDLMALEQHITFSPEASMVAIGAPDSAARLFDAEGGQAGRTLSGHEQSLSQVFVGPHAQRVLTTSADSRARLWDGQTGRSLALLADRDDPLQHAWFSPQGRWLLTMHADGERVALWDARDARRHALISKQGHGFATAAFSPDERWYVTADRQGNAYVWPTDAAEIAAQYLPRQLTPDERDLFHSGSDEERARYRKAGNQQQAARFLTLAAQVPLKSADQTRVLRAEVERLLDEYIVSGPSGPSRALALAACEEELRQCNGLGQMVEVALAERFRECGEPAVAERRLRAILTQSDFDNARVWQSWAACCLGGLRRSPAELLADLPNGRRTRETSDSATPTNSTTRPPSPAAEVRWLLERLVASKPIRIHAGGDDLTANDGTVWRHDCFFGGGFRFGQTLGYKQSSTEPIANTDDDPLYQTERWFDHSGPKQERGYSVPLPPGRYRVTLHFAEIYYRPPEKRVFDVLAEDELKLSDYNTLAAGYATADTRQFEVRVDDGLLDLEFRGRDKDPKISAIEIDRLGE